MWSRILVLIVFSLASLILVNSYGIEPTCNESKVSIDRLSEIASDSNVQSIEEFLQSLPVNSFQAFTFVTNSESLQKGFGENKVSPLWPRVIRFSADAKIVMSYVCHPENPSYNSVEVLFFNDKMKKFETASFDFKSNTENNRVKFNQSSCLGCHSYQNKINGNLSLKPNWGEYAVWGDCKDDRGYTVYGAFDDQIGQRKGRLPTSPDKNGYSCTQKEDGVYAKLQKKQYLKFKEFQKENPCYSLLPWPKYNEIKNTRRNSTQYLNEFQTYPYRASSEKSTSYGTFGYGNRPNLRLTTSLSLLNAQRIFGLLKESPKYKLGKLLISMEALECSSVDKIRRRNIPFKIERPRTNSSSKYRSGSDPFVDTPILISYAMDAGMVPGDFSLAFNTKDSAVFRAAIYSEYKKGRESSIQHVVQNLVLKETIGRSLFQTQTSRYYGQNYQCVDEIVPSLQAKAFEPNFFNKSRLCSNLAKQYNRELSRFQPPAPSNAGVTRKVKKKKVDDYINKFLNNVDEEAIKEGELLVRDRTKGKCLACHNSKSPERIMNLPENLNFIPSEDDINSKSKTYKEFKRRMTDKNFVEKLRDKVESGNMPLNSGDDLLPEERQRVLEYLFSI